MALQGSSQGLLVWILLPHISTHLRCPHSVRPSSKISSLLPSSWAVCSMLVDTEGNFPLMRSPMIVSQQVFHFLLAPPASCLPEHFTGISWVMERLLISSSGTWTSADGGNRPWGWLGTCHTQRCSHVPGVWPSCSCMALGHLQSSILMHWPPRSSVAQCFWSKYLTATAINSYIQS